MIGPAHRLQPILIPGGSSCAHRLRVDDQIGPLSTKQIAVYNEVARGLISKVSRRWTTNLSILRGWGRFRREPLNRYPAQPPNVPRSMP